MTSRKKLWGIVVAAAVVSLLIGVVIGFALSQPYFKASYSVDSTIDKTLESYQFLKDTELNSPERVREQLLLVLDFNLSKLGLMKQNYSPLMVQRICSATAQLREDYDGLIAIAKQSNEPDKHIRRIEHFMDAVRSCDSSK